MKIRPPVRAEAAEVVVQVEYEVGVRRQFQFTGDKGHPAIHRTELVVPAKGVTVHLMQCVKARDGGGIEGVRFLGFARAARGQREDGEGDCRFHGRLIQALAREGPELRAGRRSST